MVKQYFLSFLHNIKSELERKSGFPREYCKEHIVSIWLHLKHYQVRNRDSKML